MNTVKNIIGSYKRSTSSGKYLPFIDGIRFLAILPVILLHANERVIKYNPDFEQLNYWENEFSYLISRGAIGVLIFFVLSGFILSIPFAQKKNFSYKTYIGRRLERLEPPYIFWMSCFAFIFFIQSEIPLSQLLGHYFASLTYTHNIVYQEFSIINPVAWSLEVEIQYYLIAPFMAILYFNYDNVIQRRIGLSLSILLIVSAQHIFGFQLLPFKASLFGQLHLFLIGLLLADFFVHSPNWVKRKNYFWDILSPIFLVTMAFTWTEEYFKTILFVLAITGLFISSMKGRIFPRILSSRYISIIGGMCYTIYLTHLPVLELLSSLTAKYWQSSSYLGYLSKFIIIALPIILLSSMIFFKAIEQPFMKKGAAKKIIDKMRFNKTVNATN